MKLLRQGLGFKACLVRVTACWMMLHPGVNTACCSAEQLAHLEEESRVLYEAVPEGREQAGQPAHQESALCA
jgi:hypothetical protein